jgi:hypothetical protein
VPQASANFFDQLLNVFGLLERLEREDETIVLLDALPQILRHVNELRRILQVFCVLGLQNLVALRLAVGQAHVGTGIRRRRHRNRVLRRLSQAQRRQHSQKERNVSHITDLPTQYDIPWLRAPESRALESSEPPVIMVRVWGT